MMVILDTGQTVSNMGLSIRSEEAGVESFYFLILVLKHTIKQCIVPTATAALVYPVAPKLFN